MRAWLPLAALEWLSVGFAVVVAHAFFVHEWLYPSSYDASAYATAGKEIAEHGLFRNFSGSDLRTYGYPWLLALAHRLAAALGLPFQAVLFELQLAAYFTAALALRHGLAQLWPLAARLAFCGVLVDYYALIYLSQSLTEAVSLILLVVVAACFVEGLDSGWRVAPWLVGSLAAGFAMMVRPASIFLAAAWVAGVMFVVVRRRPAAVRAVAVVACVAVAMALPMLPQFRNNLVTYGKLTPFPVADLAQMQQSWGVRFLKYATALPPIARPQVYYDNPLFSDTAIDDSAPLQWYIDYPARGIATVLLHTFNLIDQDLLFTYSRDLDPWYRLPLGVVNHAIVALGVFGLFLLGSRIRVRRQGQATAAFVALLALLVANVAVHGLTAVEMRFGAGLLLVLFPLALYALVHVIGDARARILATTFAGVICYVALALSLSDWVRGHAAAIRAARTEPRAYEEPGECSRPARVVDSLPRCPTAGAARTG